MRSEGPSSGVVRLLGDVEGVSADGTRFAPSSALRRTLLALLALQRSGTVMADRLLEDAWNGEPPSSGLRALRFHISKLRVELPDGAIETVSGGYKLLMDTDVAIAERCSDPDEALALWRGQPFGGARSCLVLDNERQRLEEVHLGLKESSFRSRIDRDGASDPVVAQLTRLSLAHPLRESLWALLIEAQYRGGNQAAALESVGDLRDRLLSDLGVPPGQVVEDLERRILEHDPILSPSKVQIPGLRGHDDHSVVNLPAQFTSFVGRERDVDTLSLMVSSRRLVTLSGPGGAGKTRLALRVASDVAADFGDGVSFVDLSAIDDATSVPIAFASALSVGMRPGRSVSEAVLEELRGRRLLLVVDNCEHVLRSVTDLAELILNQTLQISILATTREPLGVAAEQVWSVGPMDLSNGRDSEAVELFVERAQAVAPGFDPDEAELAVIHDICVQMDGLALAIELSAARMTSMSPYEVRELLDARLRLFANTRPSVERHRSLRHVVAWSYDLLEPKQRSTLNRCAALVGGFDRSAVAALCRESDEVAIANELDSLVRKSLLVAEVEGRATRYRVLETVRQFLEVQLEDAGELDGLRDEHARYFASEVLARWPHWDGPEQPSVTRWVGLEMDNLRAAYQRGCDRGDYETAGAIAAHVPIIAFNLQRFEPITWAERLLKVGEGEQMPRLQTAASMCYVLGRPDDAIRYAVAGRAVLGPEDSVHRAVGLICEATAYAFSGRPQEAELIFKRLISETGIARVVGFGGLLLVLPLVGKATQAHGLVDEALSAARLHGNPNLIAYVMSGSGRLFSNSDPERALATFREGLQYARDHDLHLWENAMVRDAAAIHAQHGEPEDALMMLDAALDSYQRTGYVATQLVVLGALAAFFDRLGKGSEAAVIAGALRADLGAPMNMIFPGVAAVLDRLLHDKRYSAPARQGAGLTLSDVVQFARMEISKIGVVRQQEELR